MDEVKQLLYKYLNNAYIKLPGNDMGLALGGFNAKVG